MSPILEPKFSVSECNEMVNLHLAQLGQFTIVGEISKINLSQGKWLFITLKDAYSTVEIFGVAFQLSGWQALEEGMMVNVLGVAGIHQKSGKFSIRAEQITPAGEGSLRIAFEKLRAQLDAEGLFDPTRKRILPRFPHHIGLITAKGSQAYNDFTKILQNRLGGLHVYFLPASVQGTQAPKELIGAITYAQKKLPQLDALVICRGGGSLEDLQAFNDEHVVRAIFASSIPTIVGVGHEGDISLADLVADMRASTPSNAAEILVPERQALLNEIQAHIRHIESMLTTQLTSKLYIVDKALSHIDHTLQTYITTIYHTITHFLTFAQRFSGQITQYVQRVNHAEQRLSRSLSHVCEEQSTRLIQLERLLISLDHTQVLKRGYSITRLVSGTILTSAKNIKNSDQIVTTLSDGTIYSHVTQKKQENTYV